MEAIGNYGKLEGLRFDPTRCTWVEVLGELDKAQTAAIHSEERDNNWFIRNGRKMRRMSKTLQPALDAIPDGFSLSPLKGGLGVLFNVSRRDTALESGIP